LLLQPQILLQQPNVLLIELNILLLLQNIFVIRILTNDFVGITKLFFSVQSVNQTLKCSSFSSTANQLIKILKNLTDLRK